MRTSTILTAATGALLIAMLSACGGDASSSVSSTAVAASQPAASTSAGEAPDVAAYRDCMAQNGATMPDMGQPPAGGAMPTGTPPSAAPNGQGSVPLPDGVDQATFEAAQAACASLRPAVGPGAGADPALDQTAVAAFASCLKDHDVSVSSSDDWMAKLDRSDATVKAAMDTCSPLLPQPSLSQ